MAVMSARMPQEERVSWLARKIIEGQGKRRKDGTPYKAVGWALMQYNVKFRKGNQPDRPSKAIINAAIELAGQMRARNQRIAASSQRTSGQGEMWQ